MRRSAGSWFPVLSHSFLAAAAACSLAWGPVGVAQVWVGGELGWQGQAVMGEVNPLTITVENRTGSILSATIRAEQRVGSEWRGQITQRLRVPVLLAPAGRARFVFPWPVEAGSEPVAVVVEADGVELARIALPVRAMVEKPLALVGAVAALPAPGQAVFLAPEDLPADPLLLAPFSEVRIAPTAFVSAQARAALTAWAAFGGGTVAGLAVPAEVPSLHDDALRAGARLHRPRRAPLGLLIGGTVVYLIAMGYALPTLSRRGRPRGALALVVLSSAFALFYPYLYDTPQTTTVLLYELTVLDVAGFSSDVLTITSHWGEWWEGAGWWVERVPPGGERAGSAVEWSWGGDGVRTAVRIHPGKTVFLWRYGPGWAGGGVERVVGAGGNVAGVDAGFAPLLDAVGPLLREGDRLILDRAEERRAGLAWYVYRLRWERRG